MRSLHARLLIPLLLISLPAAADWQLDNHASTLSFVTIKAGDIAEVNSFGQLSGVVDDAGAASITIQLASVDTLIPIRDERMREVLFKTDLFPTASARTRLDMKALLALEPGESAEISAETMLAISGTEATVTAQLLVSRLSADRMQVATARPVIVNAGSVALAEGVEALREIAGLPTISKAVPVSFILQFVAQ
jgi:hypothetical protein